MSYVLCFDDLILYNIYCTYRQENPSSSQYQQQTKNGQTEAARSVKEEQNAEEGEGTGSEEEGEQGKGKAEKSLIKTSLK